MSQRTLILLLEKKVREIKQKSQIKKNNTQSNFTDGDKEHQQAKVNTTSK